jgi:hypothetical protein
VDSFQALAKRRVDTGETLGVIGPVELVKLEIQEEKQKEWTHSELLKLSQEGLFDTEEVRNRKPLRKLPYRFYYHYRVNGAEVHRHYITDWEVGALYWNCVQRYGAQWEKYLTTKAGRRIFSERLAILDGNGASVPRSMADRVVNTSSQRSYVTSTANVDV